MTAHASEKTKHWTKLNCSIAQVSSNECLILMMDIEARTGRRDGGGIDDVRALGACGRDIRYDNGKRQLKYAVEQKIHGNHQHITSHANSRGKLNRKHA